MPDLHALFEAARWAPSSYNSQPWRFLYARRGTPAFDTFLDLLILLQTVRVVLFPEGAGAR